MAKRKHGGSNSMAAARAMVEMAKTMDLAAIARKTGRKPASILKTAKRLSISIKGKPSKK
jgi:hypothetical protein